MTNEQFEFKPGDKVKCAFFGDEVFELISSYGDIIYPISIYKESVGSWYFTKGGKLNSTHTHPVLTLVERPKKKVTKTAKAWMNINKDREPFLYYDKYSAEKMKSDNCIATVELTGTYEVEE